MTLTVHLFAAAKDLAGAEVVEVQLNDGASVAALRSELMKRCPRLAALLPRCAIAVNHEFANDHALLHDGDEVAVIPPVSGGER